MNERQRKMQEKPERFTPVRTSHLTLIGMTGYSSATFRNVDLQQKKKGKKRKKEKLADLKHYLILI